MEGTAEPCRERLIRKLQETWCCRAAWHCRGPLSLSKRALAVGAAGWPGCHLLRSKVVVISVPVWLSSGHEASVVRRQSHSRGVVSRSGDPSPLCLPESWDFTVVALGGAGMCRARGEPVDIYRHRRYSLL